MWPFSKKKDALDVFVEQIQVVTLKPNDVLVIRSDDIDDKTVEHVKERLNAVLGFKVGVMVVESDTDISVFRGDQS